MAQTCTKDTKLQTSTRQFFDSTNDRSKCIPDKTLTQRYLVQTNILQVLKEKINMLHIYG